MNEGAPSVAAVGPIAGRGKERIAQVSSQPERNPSSIADERRFGSTGGGAVSVRQICTTLE